MVKKVSELDGFIFVTPEYNKAVTSGLKDAIDYLYTNGAIRQQELSVMVLLLVLQLPITYV